MAGAGRSRGEREEVGSEGSAGDGLYKALQDTGGFGGGGEAEMGERRQFAF